MARPAPGCWQRGHGAARGADWKSCVVQRKGRVVFNRVQRSSVTRVLGHWILQHSVIFPPHYLPSLPPPPQGRVVVHWIPSAFRHLSPSPPPPPPACPLDTTAFRYIPPSLTPPPPPPQAVWWSIGFRQRSVIFPSPPPPTGSSPVWWSTGYCSIPSSAPPPPPTGVWWSIGFRQHPPPPTPPPPHPASGSIPMWWSIGHCRIPSSSPQHPPPPPRPSPMSTLVTRPCTPSSHPPPPLTARHPCGPWDTAAPPHLPPPGSPPRSFSQCCFTSTETVRTIRDVREPRTSTSNFSQFLGSVVSSSSSSGVARRPQRPEGLLRTGRSGCPS